MKTILGVVFVCLLLGGYLISFLIATAPHDPDVWHQDPLNIVTSETPNSFRMAPQGSTSERIDVIWGMATRLSPFILVRDMDMLTWA